MMILCILPKQYHHSANNDRFSALKVTDVKRDILKVLYTLYCYFSIVPDLIQKYNYLDGGVIALCKRIVAVYQ